MSLSPPQRLLIGSAFLGLFLFGFQSGAWGIILPDLMVFYHLTPATVGPLVSNARSIQKQGHTLWLATLASPQVWLIGVFIASQAGLHGVLSSWLYSFALNERHLTPSFASILMSGFRPARWLE
ncbi:hypothetical protein [Ktedonobacter robiniae]|uniref:hypothetical protein n=1 Tax=Ktedonobacter robiniae TaxID=2778365 RepID=UPI0019162B54|nr:hypothetical protein [Ktedonobacter robiniae]